MWAYKKKTPGFNRDVPCCNFNILLTKYSAANKMNKNVMGGACGSYGRHEICMQGFSGETLGKESFKKIRCRWEDDIKIDPQ